MKYGITSFVSPISLERKWAGLCYPLDDDISVADGIRNLDGIEEVFMDITEGGIICMSFLHGDERYSVAINSGILSVVSREPYSLIELMEEVTGKINVKDIPEEIFTRLLTSAINIYQSGSKGSGYA